MYLLEDLHILPSAEMFLEEIPDRIRILSVFSTQTAFIEDSKPPLTLLCDTVFSDKGLMKFVKDKIQKGRDLYPFRIDEYVMNKNFQKFMTDIFEKLGNKYPLNNGWQTYDAGSVLLPKQILKEFVPISKNLSEDIWDELSEIWFQNKSDANALFFYAMELYIIKTESATDISTFKDVLFGSTARLEKNVLINFLETTKLVGYYYDQVSEYKNVPEAKMISTDNYPFYLGFFNAKVAVMLYHGEVGNPVTIHYCLESLKAAFSPAPQHAQSNDSSLPDGVVETYVFGRKMYKMPHIEASLKDLQDVACLSDKYEKVLDRCGVTLFRVPPEEIWENVGTLHTDIHIDFEIQRVQKLKPRARNVGPHILLGEPMYLACALNKATLCSHQMPPEQNVITLEEDGLAKLLGFECKGHEYLYRKGYMASHNPIDKLHAFITGKDLNNFATIKQVMAGTNIPFVYESPGISFFALHCEDINLLSLNISIRGSGEKYWFFIPKKYHDDFIDWVTKVYLPDICKIPVFCPNIIQHKILIIPPGDIPEKFEIFYVEQSPGDFVMAGSRAHHQGFNSGPNIAYAFNFANKKWADDYVQHAVCKLEKKKPVKSIKLEQPVSGTDHEKFSYKMRLERARSLLPKSPYQLNPSNIMTSNLDEQSCDASATTTTVLNYIQQFEPFFTKLPIKPIHDKVIPLTDYETQQMFPLPHQARMEREFRNDEGRRDVSKMCSLQTMAQDHSTIVSADDNDDEGSVGGENALEVACGEEGGEEEETEENSISKIKAICPKDYESDGEDSDDQKKEGLYLVGRDRNLVSIDILTHCKLKYLKMDVPMYRCKYCDDDKHTFKTSSEMNTHIKDIHKTVQCIKCCRYYSWRTYQRHATREAQLECKKYVKKRRFIPYDKVCTTKERAEMNTLIAIKLKEQELKKKNDDLRGASRKRKRTQDELGGEENDKEEIQKSESEEQQEEEEEEKEEEEMGERLSDKEDEERDFRNVDEEEEDGERVSDEEDEERDFRNVEEERGEDDKGERYEEDTGKSMRDYSSDSSLDN